MCLSRAPKEVTSWSDSWSLFDHKWLTRPFLSNRMVPIKNLSVIDQRMVNCCQLVLKDVNCYVFSRVLYEEEICLLHVINLVVDVENAHVWIHVHVLYHIRNLPRRWTLVLWGRRKCWTSLVSSSGKFQRRDSIVCQLTPQSLGFHSALANFRWTIGQ